MSQEQQASTQPSSVPRIPITSINGEGLNKFFSVLHGRIDLCHRRIDVKVIYDDGSSDTWANYESTYTSEYIEFNIRRSDAFPRDVVEMIVYGAYGHNAAIKVELVKWEGSTDNPVFKAGDTANFKLRIRTSYTIQT